MCLSSAVSSSAMYLLTYLLVSRYDMRRYLRSSHHPGDAERVRFRSGWRRKRWVFACEWTCIACTDTESSIAGGRFLRCLPATGAYPSGLLVLHRQPKDWLAPSYLGMQGFEWAIFIVSSWKGLGRLQLDKWNDLYARPSGRLRKMGKGISKPWLAMG